MSPKVIKGKGKAPRSPSASSDKSVSAPLGKTGKNNEVRRGRASDSYSTDSSSMASRSKRTSSSDSYSSKGSLPSSFDNSENEERLRSLVRKGKDAWFVHFFRSRRSVQESTQDFKFVKSAGRFYRDTLQNRQHPLAAYTEGSGPPTRNNSPNRNVLVTNSSPLDVDQLAQVACAKNDGIMNNRQVKQWLGDLRKLLTPNVIKSFDTPAKAPSEGRRGTNQENPHRQPFLNFHRSQPVGTFLRESLAEYQAQNDDAKFILKTAQKWDAADKKDRKVKLREGGKANPYKDAFQSFHREQPEGTTVQESVERFNAKNKDVHIKEGTATEWVTQDKKDRKVKLREGGKANPYEDAFQSFHREQPEGTTVQESVERFNAKNKDADINSKTAQGWVRKLGRFNFEVPKVGGKANPYKDAFQSFHREQPEGTTVQESVKRFKAKNPKAFFSDESAKGWVTEDKKDRNVKLREGGKANPYKDAFQSFHREQPEGTALVTSFNKFKKENPDADFKYQTAVDWAAKN
jgi:hypothetical protein